MSYEELLEVSKDTTTRTTKSSIEVLDRKGNRVYSKNLCTGFERFMRYDESNRLIGYSDSNGKMFSRHYTDNGVYVRIGQC